LLPWLHVKADRILVLDFDLDIQELGGAVKAVLLGIVHILLIPPPLVVIKLAAKRAICGQMAGTNMFSN
jgi:hypothetical protein